MIRFAMFAANAKKILPKVLPTMTMTPESKFFWRISAFHNRLGAYFVTILRHSTGVVVTK